MIVLFTLLIMSISSIFQILYLNNLSTRLENEVKLSKMQQHTKKHLQKLRIINKRILQEELSTELILQ